MFDRLTETAAPNTKLAQRGRELNVRVLLRSDDDETLLTIHNGAVVDAKRGPLLMPSYDFAIEASAKEWSAFLQAVPLPGHHDIMALLRRGEMHFSGNLHPLMANLLYFKLLLASLRPTQEVPA